MQPAKIIPIRANVPLTLCKFRSTCPVYSAATEVGDPIAAIYSVITQSGLVLDGAYEVQKHQVEDLLLAVDRLTIQLHHLLAA